MTRASGATTSSPPSTTLSGVQATWAILVQAAAWLLGVVTGFLVPPDFVGTMLGRVLSTENFSRLLTFILAILFGVVFLVLVRPGRPRTFRFWGVSALAALVLGVVLYFLYFSFLSSWTCSYSDGRVVTGTVLTSHGAEYTRSHPGQSCEQLIGDHVGVVAEIWTERSIWQREILLLLSYIVTVPLFAFSLMAAVQAFAMRRH